LLVALAPKSVDSALLALLADRMSGAWLALVRTGDPATQQLSWPIECLDSHATMVFDAENRRGERAPRRRTLVACGAVGEGAVY
jgi:carboxylesterase type B